MIYRFKSQATADTILLAATAEQLLPIMGKEVTAQGIVTVAQIPGAIAALHQAVIDSETQHQPGEDVTNTAEQAGDDAQATDLVRLRQRVAPLVAMLQEAADAGKDVVWGV
jgi:cyclopropane-fatty-acyl-phospholipid synthase